MTENNHAPNPPWPRVIAVVLAVGGLCWGTFLILAFGPAALVFLPFSAGYMVTAGYIVRAVSAPPLEARRVIWAASVLVQGGWLFVGLPDVPRHGPNVFVLWWTFATICSVVALVSERGMPVADEAADYDDAALVGPGLAPHPHSR